MQARVQRVGRRLDLRGVPKSQAKPPLRNEGPVLSVLVPLFTREHGRGSRNFGNLRGVLHPRTHHQNRAVGVTDHRVGDTAHKGPPNTTEFPAAYNDQPGIQLFCKGDDLGVRLAHPQVASGHRSAQALDLPRLPGKYILGLPLEPGPFLGARLTDDDLGTEH